MFGWDAELWKAKKKLSSSTMNKLFYKKKTNVKKY